MQTIPRVRRVDYLDVDAVGVRDTRLGIEPAVFISKKVTPLLRRAAVAHCGHVLSLLDGPAVTLLHAGQARRARQDRVWIR